MFRRQTMQAPFERMKKAGQRKFLCPLFISIPHRPCGCLKAGSVRDRYTALSDHILACRSICRWAVCRLKVNADFCPMRKKSWNRRRRSLRVISRMPEYMWPRPAVRSVPTRAKKVRAFSMLRLVTDTVMLVHYASSRYV